MPNYPSSLTAAHELAVRIANLHAENLACVACARAIVRAIGPGVNASIVKLITEVGKGIVILPSRGIRVSTNGLHLGVRIGNVVYDNHHPEGVDIEHWRMLFRDSGGRPFRCYERPIADLFGKIFRWREFGGFASNRFQSDAAERG